MQNKTKITVRCPNCNRQMFDKITPTTGVIELKCPKCGRITKVDLSLRQETQYHFAGRCQTFEERKADSRTI